MRVYRLAGVLVVALVMAWISAKLLFNGSVWNIVPWGILAFATAFFATSRREARALGALFGFVVSYAFLWFDNTSTLTPSKVLVLVPLIVLPALFGALCGFLAAWLGWLARRQPAAK
ncbi:MAG TPA: hypothetical protein VGR57_00660 [Ktedonobacterales bacterium]|nr:hypothetical protein [Ktedonobacterales bacterium]